MEGVPASCLTGRSMKNFGCLLAERMSDVPLKENPEEMKTLKCSLQNLRLRGQWSIRQSWSESLISGKRFCIDNPEGYSLEEFIGGEGHFGHDTLALQSMCFSFVGNQLEISFDEKRIDREGSENVCQKLCVGLDGTYRASILADGKYYASGRWVTSDEIEIEVRFSEALGAAIILLSFKESELELKVRSQIPENNSLTERYLYELKGRYLS